MNELNKKIKALPEGKTLHLNPRSVYKSDEWGMNRTLVTESDGSVKTDELIALVLENEKLQNEVELLRKGVDHYASDAWFCRYDGLFVAACYGVHVCNETCSKTVFHGVNGFDFARQIQAQVKGEGNE